MLGNVIEKLKREYIIAIMRDRNAIKMVDTTIIIWTIIRYRFYVLKIPHN